MDVQTARSPIGNGLRYAWAAPATAVGLAVAAVALALGATARPQHGVIEVAGGRLDGLVGALPTRVAFAAITLGHVVIGQNHAVLAQLRSHEHAHVRQYERWGAVFFAAYLASSVLQALLGRDPYRHNRFERQARAAELAAHRSPPTTEAPQNRFRSAPS
jgi:hypothetical protein